MRTVFISHATKEDGQFARRLANDLKRSGVQVWIAPESIRPGEDWVDAIDRGLSQSSHILIVLTPAAVTSKWVKIETNAAIALEREGRIQVIPLDVKPCTVPPLLSTYQMVSLRRDYDAGLKQLADILGVRVPPPEPEMGVRVPPPEPAPPRVTVPEPVLPTVMERLKPFEPEMVLISAGEFLIGSDPSVDEDARNDELPQHTLYLPDYYLAKTPVTNAQYAAFVQAAGHKQPNHWEGGKPPRGKEAHPVVKVSWHDAVAYCNWLSEVTGKPYRLPSEAEWEKAARGSDGRIWPWGNEWDAKRCNSYEDGRGDTTPVGAYPDGASPYGLLDMAGNVWEWTRSVYKEYPYNPDDGREDLEAGGSRMLRGGSWANFNVRYARCSCRDAAHPAFFDVLSGLRVVVSARSLP